MVPATAEWCGPCKEREPIVEDLATELDDVTVGTVDHARHPDLVEEYRSRPGRVVSALSALFVFQEGESVERMRATSRRRNAARC